MFPELKCFWGVGLLVPGLILTGDVRIVDLEK